MINARELRIGNWVTFLTYDEKSDGSLHGDSYHDHIDKAEDIKHVNDFPDSYDPIELSSEILTSCGFEKQQANEYWTHWRTSNGFSLLEWMHDAPVAGFEEKGVFYCGDGYLAVRYLHRLQNLFFVLTGEELNVQL